jgi:hypothetical protein
MKTLCSLIIVIGLTTLLLDANVGAEEIDAAKEDEYPVLKRGNFEIEIDTEFKDWRFSEYVLVMGKATWEAHQGGTWDDADDLTAELQIVYDEENLYFALVVKDDEYVAEAGNPWENDGIQLAINALTKTFPPPAGITDETHLYNFSIRDGWQQERGLFLGDAEIEMNRDDKAKETLFEWRMPVEIFAKKGTKLEAGKKIAFAIIANDSDKNAKGQTGWVGWGNHTIVFGKNPEEMKTIILSDKSMTVNPSGKLAITWGALK